MHHELVSAARAPTLPVIYRLASPQPQLLDFMMAIAADSRSFQYHQSPEVPRPEESVSELPHRPASTTSLRIVDRFKGGLPLHHLASYPFVAAAGANYQASDSVTSLDAGAACSAASSHCYYLHSKNCHPHWLEPGTLPWLPYTLYRFGTRRRAW